MIQYVDTNTSANYFPKDRTHSQQELAKTFQGSDLFVECGSLNFNVILLTTT